MDDDAAAANKQAVRAREPENAAGVDCPCLCKVRPLGMEYPLVDCAIKDRINVACTILILVVGCLFAAQQLLAAVANCSRLIALTPTGKLHSSPNLAVWLQKRVEIYGRIGFLIGGPLGFSDELLAACDEQISLSSLTFTHELAHVLLLEQLYRACTILAGERYHK